MTSFHYNITSFDFHTYFQIGDPIQEEYAKSFKESINNEFHDELQGGQIRVFKTFNHSIGPHPKGYGMFESDTRSPESFLKLLNYYQKKHGELSVLIHPRSEEGEFLDHTKNALWLGERLSLNTEILKN